MKTKLIKAISFTIILIMLLLISSNIVIPKNNTEEAGMHDYEANGILAEEDNSIDLLVLGDSEAFTSITPMQLWNDYGYTGYVCCSTAQTLAESVMYLNRTMKKQHPKMIILEASNIFTASDREEHVTQILNSMFPVLEYHDRWKYLRKEDWTEKANYNTINDLKGYHFTKTIVEAKENQNMNPTSEVNGIPRANIFYLKLIKKYCDDNDIKLTIIRTPTTFSWDYKSYNGIKQFAERHDIEFIDLNIMKDEVNIDWKHDSKDGGDHLNHFGAIKTTKFIGRYVKEKNVLKNHKEEEQFNNWHESYKNYLKITE